MNSSLWRQSLVLILVMMIAFIAYNIWGIGSAISALVGAAVVCAIANVYYSRREQRRVRFTFRHTYHFPLESTDENATPWSVLQNIQFKEQEEETEE